MTLKEQAKSLYKRAFPHDPDDFVSDFINRYFSNNCRYTVKDGKLVSMLFLLKGELKTCEVSYPLAYLYAAATHPEYRNKGLMKELIERVKKETAEQGVLLATKPASSSLFGYYSGLGFKTRFYHSKYSPSAILQNAPLLSAAEYVKTREEMLKNIPHVALKDMNFALKGLKLVGNGDFCAALDECGGSAVKEYITRNTDPRSGDTPFAMLITPQNIVLPEKLYFGPAMD